MLSRWTPDAGEACDDCRRWAGEQFRHEWESTAERMSCGEYERRAGEVWRKRNGQIAALAQQLGVLGAYEVPTIDELVERCTKAIAELQAKPQWGPSPAQQLAPVQATLRSLEGMFKTKTSRALSVAEKAERADLLLEAGVIKTPEKYLAELSRPVPVVEPKCKRCGRPPVKNAPYCYACSCMLAREQGAGLAPKHAYVTPAEKPRGEHVTVDMSGDWD